MRIVEALRGQPVHVRALATVSALALVGTVATYIVLATGLPSSAPATSPAAESDANATAELIAQRAQERAARNSTDSVLPSAPDDSTPAEQADGILYLGARYREHGVTAVLDRIEFYPSRTTASLTITNDSDADLSITLDASTLEQQLEGSALLQLHALTSSDPQTLAPGGQTHLELSFAPTNGRAPFTLLVGNLTSEATTWLARFSIDPQQVVNGSST